MGRHVLKTHVSLGQNAFSSTQNGDIGSDSKSKTKVIPSQSSGENKNEEKDQAEEVDMPGSAESDNPKNAKAFDRLKLRRQKTQEIAKLNRQHAENADWL